MIIRYVNECVCGGGGGGGERRTRKRERRRGRGRERVIVCACACMREKEREREREKLTWHGVCGSFSLGIAVPRAYRGHFWHGHPPPSESWEDGCDKPSNYDRKQGSNDVCYGFSDGFRYGLHHNCQHCHSKDVHYKEGNGLTVEQHYLLAHVHVRTRNLEST